MATDLRTASGNGSRTIPGADFNLEPARRRFRLPEVAVGLVVVLGFALAAVLWQLNAGKKDAVLAAAHAVARGDVLEAGDLRVVYVSSDDPIAHVARDQASRLVGRVALADLQPGALLTPGGVSNGPAVAPGEGVVGLALEPGQVPSSRLRVGDFVNVVAGKADGAAGAATADATDAVLVKRAEVFAVEELTTSGKVFVSLKTREADANQIAAAADRASVRLVLVGP